MSFSAYHHRIAQTDASRFPAGCPLNVNHAVDIKTPPVLPYNPHLTPDGYISACDMVLLGSKPYHMSVFVIGKWDFNKKLFEIDMEKVHNLENRKSSNIEHCKNCVVKLHCGGYCLGEIVNESGYLNGQNTLKCQAIRKLYKELGPCKPYKYLHP